jgi:hypothetical protein
VRAAIEGRYLSSCNVYSAIWSRFEISNLSPLHSILWFHMAVGIKHKDCPCDGDRQTLENKSNRHATPFCAETHRRISCPVIGQIMLSLPATT